MPARRFNDEQEKVICEMYSNGLSAEEVSKNFEVTGRTILNVLKRHGYKSRGVEANHGVPKVTPEQEDEFRRRYANGEPTKDIIADIGLKPGSTGAFMKRLQIEPRSRSKHFPSETLDVAIILIQQGETIDAVAKLADASWDSLGPALRKHGKEKGIDVEKLIRARKRGPKEETLKLRSDVVRLYERGIDVEEISKQLGISVQRVGIRLRESGIRRRQEKATQAQREEMVRRYQDGEFPEEIVKDSPFSTTVVYLALKKAGIERRGLYLGEERELEACKLYESGLYMPQTAEKMNVDISTIGKVLQRCGVEARPQKMFGEEELLQIKQQYLDGYSTIQLAEIWECHPTTIGEGLVEIGCELREAIGFGDSIQKAIINEGRFAVAFPTSFYVFTMGRFPDLLKPGIAQDVDERARDSDGEYGECLLEIVLNSRNEAFFLEQAILKETLVNAECPKELLLNSWPGKSELRRMSFSELEIIVDFYASELEELGCWMFAVKHVPMTSNQRERCEAQAEARD